MKYFWEIIVFFRDGLRDIFSDMTYGFNKSQRTITLLLITSQCLLIFLADQESLKDGLIVFSFCLIIAFFIRSRRTIRQYEKSLNNLDGRLEAFVDKKTQELQTSFAEIKRDIKTIKEQYQVLLQKYNEMDQRYLEKHEKHLATLNAQNQEVLNSYEELIRNESGAILTEVRRILENPRLNANSQLNLLKDKSKEEDEEERILRLIEERENEGF